MPKSKPPRKNNASRSPSEAKSIDSSGEVGRRINISTEKREYLLSQGYRQCIVQFYTTDGSVDDLELAMKILAPIHTDVYIDFARFDDPASVRCLDIRVFSDENNQKFRMSTSKEMWLNYILLIFAYRDEAPDNYYLGCKAGAMVSLFFGELSAKDLHYEFKVDLPTHGVEIVTPNYVIHPKVSRLRRDLQEEFRCHIDMSLAKPETIEMLGLAKYNENNPSYISNLWQAIDAQTDGDGSARKKFIVDTFSIQQVNQSIENVRSARNEFFHKGVIPALSDQDIYVALSFIRICLVPSGPLRNSLVAAFEAELTSPTPQPPATPASLSSTTDQRPPPGSKSAQ